MFDASPIAFVLHDTGISESSKAGTGQREEEGGGGRREEEEEENEGGEEVRGGAWE